MSTPTTTRMTRAQALAKLARYEGTSPRRVCERTISECMGPAICRACGAIHEFDVEPDATNYECGECGAAAVDSAPILAGLI
jgi:hypothetical protein